MSLHKEMAKYIAFGLGIGLIYYKLTEGPIMSTTGINRAMRNLTDSSINLAAWKSAGKHLTGSGHPDEVRYQYNVPTGLSAVQKKTIEKLRGYEFLLSAHHFNGNVLKRQQFKSMDQNNWPIPRMGSDWYIKAVQHSPLPYTSRTLQWIAPW